MKKIIILMLLASFLLPLSALAKNNTKRKVNTYKKPAVKTQATKTTTKQQKNDDEDIIILVIPEESIKISPATTEINTPVPKLFRIKPQNTVYLPGFAKLEEDSNDNGKFKLTVTTEEGFEKKGFWSNTGHFLKGKKGDDCVNFLMFSRHTMNNRDELNESNKLFSIDYNGYTFGTFNNSYHTQSYYVGITRKILERELAQGYKMDLKYKLMILRGYKYEEPDLAGFTPNIVPIIGFSKGLLGVDFLISPGKTATFATTFRINLEELTKKVTK
jgi:hypothetical protein